MSLSVANVSVVAHRVYSVNHSALIAKLCGIFFCFFKTAKVLTSSLFPATPHGAKTDCCFKTKFFVGVKFHGRVLLLMSILISVLPKKKQGARKK